MLGEVGIVLHIERGQRQIADQAARRDPRVIHRPRTAPPQGQAGPERIGKTPPEGGGRHVGVQDDEARARPDRRDA